MEDQINLIGTAVKQLLNQEQSGHGMDHIERVLQLSLEFATCEKADRNIVSIIALLHDVDDYKIFGRKAAAELPNAKRIMAKARLDSDLQNLVYTEIQHLGYNKRLQGIYPQTLAGQIVSDADMCDGLGVHGILRTYQYGLAHNRPFFLRETLPNLNPQDYIKNNITETSINHFFEKILQLKDLMLTTSGKHEAEAHAYHIG